MIYMDQPKGYITLENKNKVCLLKRSFYGLKQSPRQQYKRFDEFMMKIQFTRSSYDSCVHMKKEGNHIKTYLLLYVDDMLIANVNKTKIQSLKSCLTLNFT
ncbi:hypothetical protein Pfo_006893 [Paulownia fortunei]|nr:hypothetical protein Pfo_006893 [Paulownia fortunei]